jgi:hypothetical protein
MTERHDIVVCHGQPPTQLLSEPFCSLSHTGHNQKFRRAGKYFGASPLTYLRQAIELHFCALQVRSKSSVSPVVVALSKRRFPCTGTYNGTRIPRVKSSDRTVGRRTPSSNPSLPTSPTRFGLRTPRLNSQRFVAAAFAPLSAISADNENGRATRSPPSFPKSSVVTPCGTSRSFPNGHRCPF